MATRIQRGTISLHGSNEVSIGYSGFSGTPSVVATVKTDKNGGTVSILKIGSGGATLRAYYNGGLKLTSGTIYWIAIGPTNYVGYCNCEIPAHRCSVCTVFD